MLASKTFSLYFFANAVVCTCLASSTFFTSPAKKRVACVDEIGVEEGETLPFALTINTAERLAVTVEMAGAIFVFSVSVNI